MLWNLLNLAFYSISFLAVKAPDPQSPGPSPYHMATEELQKT